MPPEPESTISEAISLHEWQRDELAKRKANLAANPGTALTWDEIVRRVRARCDR